jgi:sulfoxide reductase heme-binding subunit YedZ
MNNQPTASQLSLIKAALFAAGSSAFCSTGVCRAHQQFGARACRICPTLDRHLDHQPVASYALHLASARATQWHWILRLRRTLGLFTFFYALLHFLSFIGFEHSFNLDEIARDIFKRPYVLLGFAAFVILIPLAATSNQFAIRRLGGRRWQELHRSIYLIAILGCLHYFWLTKAENLMWPVAYSVILGLLLRWRIRERKRKAVPVPQTLEAKPLRFFKQKPD